MTKQPCPYHLGLRHWHPLLASRQLRRRTPIRRLLCGEPMVLFRTESGKVAAVAEVCPHRRMSLAAGVVEGENLICAYHGWRFSPDGQIACPMMPQCNLRQPVFEARESEGLVWVRQAQSGSPTNQPTELPTWPTDDLKPSGIIFHRVSAPLELTLDNFVETEHTTKVHQVFGFTDPRAVELKLDLDSDATKVWNSGPRKHFPPLFNGFIDIRPGDRFTNNWVTSFRPLLTVYEQGWQYTPRKSPSKQRRFRLRVVIFFLPIDSITTQLTTLIYTPRLLPGPLHNWLAAPVVRWIAGNEINLDVLALSRLADLDPELNPRTLGPFDKVLLENRRRIHSIYLAG